MSTNEGTNRYDIVCGFCGNKKVTIYAFDEYQVTASLQKNGWGIKPKRRKDSYLLFEEGMFVCPDCVERNKNEHV